MPVSYRIRGRVVEILCRGRYVPDEIIDTFDGVLADAECPPRFGLLVDVSESESLSSTPTSEIVRIAEYLGPHRDKVDRCAVHAVADVHFGLSRVGAVYSEAVGVETRVFRSREDAAAWLGGREIVGNPDP